MPLSRTTKLGLWAFLAVDAVLVVVFVGLLVVRSERQQDAALRDLGATIYPTPVTLSNFSLLDHNGREFSDSDLQGHWSLLFFGFTSCPDICPLTLAELEKFYRALGEDAVQRPRVVLVSLDPVRDTPPVMANYLKSFHQDFIGLSGDMSELSRLAEALYVAFSDSESAGSHAGHGGAAAAGGYGIDHSVHISVISPDGKLFAVLRAPHRQQDLLEAWAMLARQ